jgi:hypothetical protein
MVSNVVVGSSIILLGWYIPLGLVIDCSNLPLSMVISLVLLLLTNIGL